MVSIASVVFLNLLDRENGSDTTLFLSIRNTVIAVDFVGHLPTPILFRRHGHCRPLVNPHMVIPDSCLAYIAGDDWVCAFMTSPHFIIRICFLRTIWLEIAVDWRASTHRWRIKVLPIFWSSLLIEDVKRGGRGKINTSKNSSNNYFK